MSVMSDLDLLHRDGAVTQNDFIERGIEPRRAKAFAEIVEGAATERLSIDLGVCFRCGSELDDGFACLGECL